MTGLRLTVRRLLLREPLTEFGHNFCPLFWRIRFCACLQGWDHR